MDSGGRAERDPSSYVRSRFGLDEGRSGPGLGSPPMAKVDIPETRYARNGPVSIANQVVGDGPLDVL